MKEKPIDVAEEHGKAEVTATTSPAPSPADVERPQVPKTAKAPRTGRKTKPLGKDVKLLVAAAFLGILPSLITVWFTAYYAYRQMIIDRRITALKEYSSTNSQIASSLIPKTEVVLERYLDLESSRTKVEPDTFRELGNMSRAICREAVAIDKAIQTHEILIIALYEYESPIDMPDDPRCFDTALGLEEQAESGDEAAQERLRRIRDIASLPDPEYIKVQIENHRILIGSFQKREHAGAELIKIYAKRIDY